VSCDLKQGNFSVFRLLCPDLVNGFSDWTKFAKEVVSKTSRWKLFIENDCATYARKREHPKRLIDTENRIARDDKTILFSSKRLRQIILGQTRPRKLSALQKVLMQILATQLKEQLSKKMAFSRVVDQPFLFSTDELIFPVNTGFGTADEAKDLIKSAVSALSSQSGVTPSSRALSIFKLTWSDIVRVSSLYLERVAFDEEMKGQHQASVNAPTDSRQSTRKHADLSDESDDEESGSQSKLSAPFAKRTAMTDEDEGKFFYVRHEIEDNIELLKFKCVTKDISKEAVQAWAKLRSSKKS